MVITMYCTVIGALSGGTPMFGCSHSLFLFRWPFDSYSSLQFTTSQFELCC